MKKKNLKGDEIAMCWVKYWTPRERERERKREETEKGLDACLQ